MGGRKLRQLSRMLLTSESPEPAAFTSEPAPNGSAHILSMRLKACRCAELESQNAELQSSCERFQAELSALRQGLASSSADEDLPDMVPTAAAVESYGGKHLYLDGAGRGSAEDLGPLGRNKLDLAGAGAEDLGPPGQELQELAGLMAEVSLETSRRNRPADTKALVQRLAAQCQRLLHRVEDSTAVGLRLSQAVGDLRGQTLAAAATLGASEAVKQDPVLTAEVARLQDCGNADVFEKVGEAMARESAYLRLCRKAMTEAWRQRQEQHEARALEKWMPTVRLAGQREEAKAVPMIVGLEARAAQLGTAAAFSPRPQASRSLTAEEVPFMAGAAEGHAGPPPVSRLWGAGCLAAARHPSSPRQRPSTSVRPGPGLPGMLLVNGQDLAAAGAAAEEAPGEAPWALGGSTSARPQPPALPRRQLAPTWQRPSTTGNLGPLLVARPQAQPPCLLAGLGAAARHLPGIQCCGTCVLRRPCGGQR